MVGLKKWLVGPLLALCVWLVLVYAQGLFDRPTAHCRPASCTNWSLIKAQPYCLLDPTCASPLVRNDYTAAQQAKLWSGMAWFAALDNAGFVIGPTNPLTSFSFPNFSLFAAALTAIWSFGRRLVAPPSTETLRNALSIFYVLEVSRWLFIYFRYIGGTDLTVFVDPATYLVLGPTALAPLPWIDGYPGKNRLRRLMQSSPNRHDGRRRH